MSENVGKVIGEFDSNVTWILTGSGYKITEDKLPVVVLFARNYHNKFETRTFEFTGFRPYFYCPANEVNVKLPYYAKYVGEPLLDALGREVVKVETRIPSQVASKFNDAPAVRDLFSFTDMSDFLFEKRFLVDHHIKYAFKIGDNGIPYGIEVNELLPLRVLWYDIEILVEEKDPFPNPMDSEKDVCMIQVGDSYNPGKYLLFTNGIPQTDEPDHIACSSEKELFDLFLTHIETLNPDLITGWSTRDFDLPYLFRRSAKVGVNFNRFARMGKISSEYNKKYGEFRNRVGGRSTLDMMVAFKKFTSVDAQRESYGLKNISKEYGFEYKDYGPILSNLIKRGDYKTFLQYGRNDIIALENIEKKSGVLAFYDSFRKRSGCDLDDTMHITTFIDMMMLHGGIRPMPRKNYVDMDNKEKFEGAVVHKTFPGIHKDIITLDAASLYPTAILAFQLSPDIDGFIPKMIKSTMDERERLRAACKKDPDNKTLYYAQMFTKIANNSYFGYLGAKSSRMYKKEIAEEITRRGREINFFLKNKAESEGLSVIAGDTDSIFIKGVHSVEDGLLLEKRFNKYLEEYSSENNARVIFKLKFEKFFRTLMFKFKKNGEAAKKKYIGHLIWEEGRDTSELYDKGSELTRSDVSRITKEIMKNFLNYILMDDNPSKASLYIKEMYSKVRNGEVSVFDISIPKAVRTLTGNDNVYKRGIKNTQQYLHHTINEGEKPRLVHLTTSEPDVFCIDEDLTDLGEWNLKVDWETMLEKNVTDKIKSYLEAAGLNWNSIIHGQQNLDRFFK